LRGASLFSPLAVSFSIYEYKNKVADPDPAFPFKADPDPDPKPCKAVSWPTYALSGVAHGVEGEEVVLANLELISAPRIITRMVQWVITRI
jgi:hypothetical protein